MSDNKQLKEKVNVNSFNTISIIGKGQYALVMLVKKKDDQKLYAMKIIKKQRLQDTKQTNNILTERQILSQSDCQFLVKLAYAFQNEENLYFILEYCPGGELFNLLQQQHLNRLTEKWAKFYSLQMLLALKHLHSKDIIYRDLKPENIIIDRDGYIKLTDFGLSKITYYKTYTVVGTPEYFAPEILKQNGHDKSVDFWTLGCIIYEMITGNIPFYTQNRKQLFKMIIETEPQLPQFISDSLKDLLSKLFQKEPQKRLGSQNGADEVLKHPWFSELDVQKVIERLVIPQFKPQLKSDIDVQNFDQEFTNLQFSQKEQTELSYDNQKQYMMGFSYNKSSHSTQKIQENINKHCNFDKEKDNESSLNSEFMSVNDSQEYGFYIETNNKDLNYEFQN